MNQLLIAKLDQTKPFWPKWYTTFCSYSYGSLPKNFSSLGPMGAEKIGLKV